MENFDVIAGLSSLFRPAVRMIPFVDIRTESED